jgi:hypothetical protein
MSNVCFTTDATGLNDEERKGYERNTRYRRETTIDGEIRKTNTSSVQFNINRGRK